MGNLSLQDSSRDGKIIIIEAGASVFVVMGMAITQ